MPDDAPPPDDERLYALIQDEDWREALGWLHRAWQRLGGNARARRAAEVFDEAFLADLGARSSEALEQRLMLHHGRMRALPDAQLARLTGALSARRQAAGDDEAVRALRRLSPRGGAAARTRENGVQRSVVEAQEGVRLTRVGPPKGTPKGTPDARASLFKSEQERVFFEALRAVFPTHLAYPNAALSAVLDYERLQSRLTQEERDYFFRALVDAVVVDPAEGDLWPVYFFELDSAHHDAAERRRHDRCKDRIFAKAGQTLFRLRRTGAGAGQEAFEKAIRAALRAS